MAYKSTKQAQAHQTLLKQQQRAYFQQIGLPTITFPAKFKGSCKAENCGTGVILKGDQLCYFENQLIHFGCADRIVSIRRREASCAKCKGLNIYKDENGQYQNCDC